MSLASYADFKKLELKVAEIVSVEPVEGADKLYKLSIDAGEEEPRTLLAGLRPYYSSSELVGKKIIVIANLEPRKMRGIESNGMLLAAESDDHSIVSLLVLDRDVPSGSSIY